MNRPFVLLLFRSKNHMGREGGFHLERRGEALQKEAVTFLEASPGSLTSGPHSGKRDHILTGRTIFAPGVVEASLARTTCLTHRKGKETNIYRVGLMPCAASHESLQRGCFLHVYLKRTLTGCTGKQMDKNTEKGPLPHLAEC